MLEVNSLVDILKKLNETLHRVMRQLQKQPNI